MATETPKLAFTGDAGSALAQQLRRTSDLVALDGDPAGVSALVVDGGGVSSQVAAVLEAGRPVVLTNPAGDDLAELGRLTGVGFGAPAPLVACVKDPRGRYHPYVVGKEGESGLDLGQAVDAAVNYLGVAPPDALVGDTPPGLIPPFGATWGRQSFTVTVPSCSLTQPTQTLAGGSLLSWVYVYWVDGATPPYYTVVIQQTGSMSPGSVALNTDSERAWFMYQIQVFADVEAPGGGSFPAGVTMLGHSPTTAASQPGIGVPVMLQVPMELVSGTTQPFTATVADSLTLTDWGVQDVSQTAQSIGKWQFHQVTAWDPIADPLSAWNDWKDTVQQHGQVVPMPNASFGTVAFETASAYRFDSSMITGKSLPVRFGFSLTELFVAITATTSPGDGVWGLGYPFIVDLGTILGQQ
jgi:hypothetical protein